MTQQTVISLSGVSFSYDGLPVLENVNFSVAENELICIIGPNGGGKTTLLKIILGQLHPQTGRVTVFGTGPAHARRRIGYMPQHTRHDPAFPVTVLDVVLMGRLERHIGGPYRGEDREAAFEALEEVGLADAAGRRYFNLSGGQRQRVLIARALASRPDLLILDEPTANVDVVVETRLVEILKKLNDRMTILMVSHDIGFVSSIVDRVVCVSRCVVVHPTSQISADLIREMYGSDFCIVRHDHSIADGGHA